jgi:hypothetical protein
MEYKMDHQADTEAVLKVSRDLAGHCRGNAAFANTVFAIYGVSSKAGRYCDRNANRVPWWRYIIGEAFKADFPPITADTAPSPAAAKMIETELARYRGRKILPTQDAVEATIGYIKERQGILGEALKLMRGRTRERELGKAMSAAAEVLSVLSVRTLGCVEIVKVS